MEQLSSVSGGIRVGAMRRLDAGHHRRSLAPWVIPLVSFLAGLGSCRDSRSELHKPSSYYENTTFGFSMSLPDWPRDNGGGMKFVAEFLSGSPNSAQARETVFAYEERDLSDFESSYVSIHFGGTFQSRDAVVEGYAARQFEGCVDAKSVTILAVQRGRSLIIVQAEDSSHAKNTIEELRVSLGTLSFHRVSQSRDGSFWNEPWSLFIQPPRFGRPTPGEVVTNVATFFPPIVSMNTLVDGNAAPALDVYVIRESLEEFYVDKILEFTGVSVNSQDDAREESKFRPPKGVRVRGAIQAAELYGVQTYMKSGRSRTHLILAAERSGRVYVLHASAPSRIFPILEADFRAIMSTFKFVDG